MLKYVLAVGLVVGLASPSFAAVYEVDKAHTVIGFGVKHLLVSTTKGQFGSYDGMVEYDPANPAKFSVNFTIDVNSIDTNNTDRDNHLKAEDFFDAAKYPKITFNNAALIKTEVGGTSIVGDLTIKETTQKVTIPVEITGPVKHPFNGKDVIGIAGETMINRQDFGVSFNKTMETGGLIVDDMVKISIDAEFHARDAAPAAAVPVIEDAKEAVAEVMGQAADAVNAVIGQ